MNTLKQTVWVVILVLVVCLSPIHAADKLDENYCHDQKSWAEWDELIRRYPEDTPLQMLHALRIGFCKKIEDGTISFEEASMIFSKLHDQVIKEAQVNSIKRINHYNPVPLEYTASIQDCGVSFENRV